jgi:hypothetical protein
MILHPYVSIHHGTTISHIYITRLMVVMLKSIVNDLFN